RRVSYAAGPCESLAGTPVRLTRTLLSRRGRVPGGWLDYLPSLLLDLRDLLLAPTEPHRVTQDHDKPVVIDLHQLFLGEPELLGGESPHLRQLAFLDRSVGPFGYGLD